MITLGEKAQTALRMVREAPVISYDTESSGLDWKTNWPVGYVIAVGKDSHYVPIRHAAGGNLADLHCRPLETVEGPFAPHAFEKALADAFTHRRTQPGFKTVGHNLNFDMHMSANAGIYLGRECEDTQLNEAMLDEFTRSYSLANCAKAHKVTAKLGDDLYQHLADMFGGDVKPTQMGNFWRIAGNDPLGVEYSEGDGVSTYELWESQQRLIAEDRMEFIHRVECRLIWTVFKMERRGVKVDATRLGAIKDELAKRLQLAKLELPIDFNERSGPQVRKLMEDQGHTNWPTTDLGNPSFPEKWLKKTPTGRAIVAVRKITNLSNSFITPLEERHIHKGRVHCQLNQLKGDEYGTISGRFSSSRPNMQQVPKRDKDLGGLFRSIFVPDEGMEFVEADYSQCEPRLFAHYSQEPALVEGYNRIPPLDMHDVVATSLNVERDPTAKRMNMGILTGMQIPTFAANMGWDKDHATEMFNAWFRTFPGIKKFQNDARDAFSARGYVKTLLGRRCRLEQKRFAYRGTSRIIQGGNADIIKYKILQCDEYIESEGLDDTIQLLLTVHDSLEWQNLLNEAGRRASAELVRICCDVQTEPFNLKVPFIMDVGRGPDWCVATYGDKDKEFDDEEEG